MFTGLVEAVGQVIALEAKGEQARLTLQIPFADDLQTGDSVAINGCCLTVAGLVAGGAAFDLLGQTLKVTSLGGLRCGSKVNLERALRMGDRFGGHFVQGHVDATGQLVRVEARGQDHVIAVSLPPAIRALCVDKGSLAVDGISLTIAELTPNEAVFWITPHTWDHTHLHAADIGQPINLEADMLAKHVAQLLDARLAAITPA